MPVYNFSAGPAALPKSVLARAASEMQDYQGTGMSVMEMSHRSPEYLAIFKHVKNLFIKLMRVPDTHEVLFLQGGATLQFAMVPMNMFGNPGMQAADYIISGSWSKKAFKEAKTISPNIEVAATTEQVNFSRIPEQDELHLDPTATYVHMTTNNTIFGTEFHYVPDTGKIPLVADASSNIMSRPMDVSKFGIIYAGAQKNLGPSGVTVVIIRKDLLMDTNLPVMLSYKELAEEDSMLNTPPTYSIYILGLMLDWIEAQGGVGAIGIRNTTQALNLYDVIDRTDFYVCPTELKSRSRMNVPFTIHDASLTDKFLKEAEQEGLRTLKGHRSVGGMRASIYNGMPDAGVQALMDFMRDFEQRYG